jgi:hypothetical protein
MAIVLGLAPWSRRGTRPHEQQRPRLGTMSSPVAEGTAGRGLARLERCLTTRPTSHDS